MIRTPHGEGRLVTDRAPRPVATLLLSHGAGNGIDTPTSRRSRATCPRTT